MKSKSATHSVEREAQTLQWHVCDDERDWMVVQSRSVESLAAQTQKQPWVRSETLRWRVPSLLLVISLATLGGWWFLDRGQKGIDQVKRELRTAVVAEQWGTRHNSMSNSAPATNEAFARDLPIHAEGDETEVGEIVTQLEIRDLGKDWAVVETVIQPTTDGPSYRQTRVYNEGDRGWIRAESTAERWGAARQFESKHFVFDYYALDEAAIVQAAAQLETLYPLLPDGEKLRIVVDPKQAPGVRILGKRAVTGIGVASPNATLVPSELAASDVLLQSMVVALYSRIIIKTLTNNTRSRRFFYLSYALRLWFIWEHELPLAVWRKPLVQWILEEPGEIPRSSLFDAPAFAHDLCVHHSIWMHSPLAIGIPILCWQSRDGEEMITAWPYRNSISNSSFNTLIYAQAVNMGDMDTGHDAPLPQPGPHEIVLATAFEYMTARYGEGSVPRLVAAIPEHERADTLIPALFGISLDEFTQGWRAFLAERYELE